MTDYEVIDVTKLDKAEGVKDGDTLLLIRQQGDGTSKCMRTDGAQFKGADAYDVAKANGFSGTREEWAQQVARINEVSAAIDNANDTANHPTKIGADNYVYEWNKATKAYQKTDILVKGDKGERGATGAQGPQGLQGVKGERGATGAQGPQGLQGVKGERGATGAQGPQGLQGATGPRGAMGAQGPQGERGENGKSPIIKNASWWLWDEASGAYKDSGMSVSSQYTLTKEAIEGVLTGDVSSHTHSAYALKTALDSYYTITEIDSKGYLTEQSLNGYVTSTALTTKLADYATQGWITEQKFAKTSAIPTKVSDLNNDSGFLTSQSLAGYVNDVNVTEVTNGNGIASISKDGSSLIITQGTFVTKDSLNGYWNKLSIFRTGNGIADIWVDNKNKSEICINRRDFVTPETLGTSIDEYASQQGYLTKDNIKENMKETVVIKLVSDKSESDTNLNGATVTVKSGDTTVSTQTWQGSPISVDVPCDKDVTIEVGTVKMYMKPKALTYAPSLLYNRKVTFTYKALSLGTYIIDINDNLIDRNSWDENTQPAVGVALITEKVAIVIPTGTKYSLKWSTQRQLVEGATVASTASDAFNDYKGKANTEAIVSALGTEAEAAYYCYNYTFKNGRKGYLMSVGEAMDINENIVAITSLLNVIDSGVVNLDSDMQYWTSTQCNITMAWRIKEEKLDTFIKDYTQPYTIPIYSLYD